MYAIVEIQGQQFKVSEGQEIFVHRLAANEGDQVTFNKVLLLAKDDTYQVGKPTLSAEVQCSVINHVKGDKVIVFHKKRRKGYRKKNGHRQSFTKIKVNKIS
jgi:large subunit ribosomal protein L21